MKVISLFTGAGGLDLGFMLAGHEIIWANDFDASALDTYIYNLNTINPHKVILGDITEILNVSDEKIDELIPDGDILIGGFPCQGFSIANINRSMSDSRNHLYLEILKVIKVKNPKYFLLENVKGLENMEKGKILEIIIKDLENIGMQYSVAYNVFNACDYGVPQNRERVIIVGVRKDIENSIFQEKSKKETLKDYKSLKIEPTHFKDGNIKSAYNSVQISNLLYKYLKNKNYEKIDQIMERVNKRYKYLTIKDVIADLPLEFKPNDKEILNHDGTKCVVNINGRVGNRVTEWDKISPTIMGRGSGTGGPLIIPHPNLHRRMSVREVARIQTFPDNFYFKGSNSAQYRQIGNAVPPLFAYYIGKLFK